MDTTFALIGLAIFCIVAFIVILICRELSCWYFKINEALSLFEKHLTMQEETYKLLLLIDQHIKAQPDDIAPADATPVLRRSPLTGR